MALRKVIGDWLSSIWDRIGTAIADIANVQHETEWSSVPAVDQVASVDAASLTAGSIAVTYPTGATRVRAILVASIHAVNQTATTHHINLIVQGQKDAEGYGNLLDLSAQDTLGLVNLDGAADGWCGTIDITDLVDTSGSTYTFKFLVDSDDANIVDYTSGFTLVLVYTICGGVVIPELTVEDFQANPATGTLSDPERINDDNVNTNAYTFINGRYAEVDLGSNFRIKQYRQYGSSLNEGDGVFKIEYWDGSWHDWITDISIQNYAGWSDWIEGEEVTGSKLRFTVTTVDTGGSGIVINELEVKY